MIPTIKVAVTTMRTPYLPNFLPASINNHRFVEGISTLAQHFPEVEVRCAGHRVSFYHADSKLGWLVAGYPHYKTVELLNIKLKHLKEAVYLKHNNFKKPKGIEFYSGRTNKFDKLCKYWDTHPVSPVYEEYPDGYVRFRTIALELYEDEVENLMVAIDMAQEIHDKISY